jgi:MarR family transcriptional regulator, organic hydroperoxide resistance regulator
MTEHDAQIESILQAQRTVIRTLHETSTSWLELNVSMAQLKTLIVLNDEGPLPVGQVGCRMGVTLPTASYQVDRLVRAGLVERVQDERDRRRTLVHLTEKATELVRSLRQGRAEHLRSWLKQLSEEDIDALERGLSTLASVASQQQGTGPEHEETLLAAGVETESTEQS